MIQWVRHRWVLQGTCCESVGEAFTECGSPADAILREQFDSTRDVGVDYPLEREADRLMKGWIRFG